MRASRAADATFSGVMKFTVPSSSSSPHRPQFEKRFAISRTSAIVNESFLRVIAVPLGERATRPSGPR